MSEVNPISTAFKMQRATIDGGQEAFRRSLDLQRGMLRGYANAISSQRAVQRQTLAVSRQSTNVFLDVLESWLPDDTPWLVEFRTVVSEQFEAIDDLSDQSWETFESLVRENVEAYDEVSQETLDALDDAFEAAREMQVRLEEQTMSATEAIDIDVE